MEDINKTEPQKTEVDSSDPKLKTRSGNGYLKQLFSTARTTANSTHTQLKNLTTFLVNFVPVDKIDASELQVRSHFEDSELQGLCHSIREHGVLQPILVVQDGDRYKVIAGERRLRASKLAGLDRIPARVLNTDDKGTHEVALRENLDRVDLHPLEEGEGYVSLLEAQAYTSYEGIAKAFNKPKSRITECIGFTRLPEETKNELLKRGVKQRAILRKLLDLPPEQHMEVIINAAATEAAMAEGLLDAALAGTSAATPATPDAGAETLAAAKKREPKPFECKCNHKGVTVPGFRWKVGEGPEKLEGFVIAMNQLLADIKQIHPTSGN